MKNNVLIYVFEDDSKRAVSFPLGTSEDIAIEKTKHLTEERKAKHTFFIEGTSIGAGEIESFAAVDEQERLLFDGKARVALEKSEVIKQIRNSLLQLLDVPFMRTLEDDCSECREKIIKLKKFLRGVPDNLRFDEIDSIENILRYNPFNNIFNIAVAYGGSGYTEPPKITISPPDGKFFGFAAEAKAYIEDGKVNMVEITYPGCGYEVLPKEVIVEAPKEGETAVIVVGNPENPTEMIPLAEGIVARKG